MQIPVYNMSGEVVKQIDVSDDVFTVPFNGAVVHQAVVRQLANARQGTACTKTRGEVTGSNRKLYQQKHTGNARAAVAVLSSVLNRGVIIRQCPRRCAAWLSGAFSRQN